MRRQLWLMLTGGIVLAGAGIAGCDELSRMNDSLAQQSPPIEAQDRLEQQLGDLPSTFDTTAASRLSGAFRAASARALPAVVQISTIAVTDVPTGFFPGLGQETERHRTQGSGSGFIFDASGYILTNHHVVRNAVNLTVSMLDGREFNARVVGSDPNTDVAVIRVEPGDQKLPVIELGESQNVRVGDWVIALGNPLGLTFTATAGIVSAKARSIGILAESGAGETALEAFIQTDAAINPGNSGGPLVDLNGRVIGINSAIESPTGFFSGAGFAIPIDLAKKVADDIVQYGAVHRPRLGVAISDVNAADAEVYGLSSISGVEITQLTPGEPADRAGLQLGDVILRIDDQPVNSVPDLQARVAQYQPGDRIEIAFVRYGKSMRTTVALGQFEATQVALPEEPPRRQGTVVGFQVTSLPPGMRSTAFRGEDVPVVVEVDPLGPAAGSGLRRGQVIRRFNGRDIRTVRDLERAIEGLKSGQVVSMIVVDVTPADALPTIVNYRVQ